MRCSTSTLALATGVLAQSASAQWGGWPGRFNGSGGYPGGPFGGQQPNCINSTGADTLVEGYKYLLEHPGGEDFNSTANAILSATNFTVQSDSILTLSGRPLGQPAYPSKDVFIATQFQTPPLPVVDTLDVFWDCDQISWRWNSSGIGSNQYPVRGFIVMEVDVDNVQINTVYSEFNTLAFAYDLGEKVS